MTPTAVNTSAIPGWGVDADPENDPTWPMRDQSRDDGPGRNWTRPPLQPESVEVLMSIEHNQRPAVFGTAAPPKGLSGVLRRRAFAFSESQWMHWLLLMGADRVNEVEGVLEDLGRGRVPNVFKEMGLKSEWEHNRAAFIRRTAATIAVTAGVAGLLVYLAQTRDD